MPKMDGLCSGKEDVANPSGEDATKEVDNGIMNKKDESPTKDININAEDEKIELKDDGNNTKKIDNLWSIISSSMAACFPQEVPPSDQGINSLTNHDIYENIGSKNDVPSTNSWPLTSDSANTKAATARADREKQEAVAGAVAKVTTDAEVAQTRALAKSKELADKELQKVKNNSEAKCRSYRPIRSPGLEGKGAFQCYADLFTYGELFH